MKQLFATTLMAGASLFAIQPAQAQGAPASAQAGEASADADAETIVVTGSRVITNGNNSPTPITMVTTEALTQAKPTTVFEALLEQPLIAAARGGKTAGSTGQGGNNNSAAVLNLRGLGATRGLVLLDGHRVPPQNLDGTVDLNQIPQMLLQRVDLQTGGSSAVYGSDAITGVVNFIIDRKFNGLKLNTQVGISQYADEPTVNIGGAWGKELFDGRGHFEASLDYRYDAGLFRTDRDYVQKLGAPGWTLQGNGCPGGTGSANCAPYFITNTAVDSLGTFGGKINQITGQPAASINGVSVYGLDFTQNGAATPFVNGSSVGFGTNQLGGGGGWNNEQVTLATPQKFLQAFGRFDFDVSDNVHFYVMGFYDRIKQYSSFLNLRANGASASSALAQGFRLTPDNAFLPDNIAAAMKGAGVTAFNLGKYFSAAQAPVSSTSYTNQNFYVDAGFEGKLADWNWNVSYVGTRVSQANRSNQTWSTARLFAALDTVKVNGTPTCWVLTQAQYAANFAGCVPLNPFGPTSASQAAIDYVRQPTYYEGITSTYDFSGAITGSPFETWAGPVKMALSGEYRKIGYELRSDAPPANISALDCNALGLLPSRTSCVQQSATNIGTTGTYANGTAARSPVSQNVAEGAIEVDVPLLKDVPLAQDVHINAAARYADYNSKGNVIAGTPYTTAKFHATTWKVGLDWHVNDMITIRATRSKDFRAPNLSELYTPGRSQGLTTGTDFLTNSVVGTGGYTLTQQIGGNPNLKPEVGNTTTAGIVFKPSPRFSLAVDAYFIRIKDAIVFVDGSLVQFQNACYDSGGTSPYCALQVRPGGFSRTPANQASTNAATLFFTNAPINAATLRTSGFDVEMNYKTDIGGHALGLRFLGTYQPTLRTLQPSAVTTDAAGVSVPKVRLQGMINYNVSDEFRIDWTTRWRSKLANVDPLLGLQTAPGSLYVDPVTYSNVNFSYKPKPSLELFFNVQNVFNQKPPPYAPQVTGAPGSLSVGFYPSDDAIGRYFILGARMKL
ncbi:TonB-dependent receptor [Novosphingobium flavum]|uniref:TonB-dependent receptor n=1 Tax=Novosphingobium flavum TaxID=1778672 RepID=A0A7X1FQV1_9SPHN|nr:TonB-dependent receptor [Novosphingobium flavum]MBC2665284.1 TonB-dependent receptor [Novosphingobium flavum]